MEQGYQTAGSDTKQTWIWMLLSLLMVSLCTSWGVFASRIQALEVSTEGLNYIEYISSSTQRLVKLELTGTTSDELIFNLSNTVYELSSMDGDASEYFGTDQDIIQGISDMSTDWMLVQSAVTAFRYDGDATTLLSSSERHFYHTADLANKALDYISDLSQSVMHLQILLIIQMAAIGLVIGSRLLMAFVELKHNRELAASMFIDVSTGLFNRSKCQEILRKDMSVIPAKYQAMVVFDLNDLKKTNDQFGHRVGDELIFNFAQILKNATKIHNYEIFLGRYGGDEFIAYYSNVDPNDVRLYLEEVAFLAEAFNEKEERYQISYAAGRAFASPEAQQQSIRQLFDVADQQMYANKMKMKRQAQQVSP